MTSIITLLASFGLFWLVGITLLLIWPTSGAIAYVVALVIAVGAPWLFARERRKRQERIAAAARPSHDAIFRS